MSKNKSKLLTEKINLIREELEKIIQPDHILTNQTLFLSEKLDRLIIEYYRI